MHLNIHLFRCSEISLKISETPPKYPIAGYDVTWRHKCDTLVDECTVSLYIVEEETRKFAVAEGCTFTHKDKLFLSKLILFLK